MIHMLETNLLITVQFDEARCLITHLAHLTAEPVFEHIVDKFHDVQFEKLVRKKSPKNERFEQFQSAIL